MMTEDTKQEIKKALRRVKVLTLNTFTKELRNKQLIFLFAFNLIALIAIHFTFNIFTSSGLGVGEGADEMQDLGLGAMLNVGSTKMMVFYYIVTLYSSLIALMLGSNAIRSDEHANVLQLLLALPIRRSEYLFSRLLGTWLSVVVFYFASFMAAGFLFFISGDNFGSLLPLLQTVFFTCFLLPFPMILLGILLGNFLSRNLSMLAGLFSSWFILYVNYRFMGRPLAESLKGLAGLWDYLTYLLYWVFPRIGVMGKIAHEYISKAKEHAFSLPAELFHFTLTTFILFYFTLFFFKRKNS